ncbi:hypothetical protein PENTCL1PPCAC_15476, partial [Pristionchus entomophagus]
FGQLPVLEVDGEQLGQTYAINRYLAQQFGFAGATRLEAARVDAVADLQQDYYLAVYPIYPVLLGFAKGDKEQLKKDIAIP